LGEGAKGTRPCPLPQSISHHLKPRPADGLASAYGAAGRDGKALPFFEDKAAVFAGRGEYVEAAALARGLGDVGEVVQRLLFRNPQLLGEFQSR